MNIFNGLQAVNNINRNHYTMLANIQDVKKKKYELIINIATAYLNILFKRIIGCKQKPG